MVVWVPAAVIGLLASVAASSPDAGAGSKAGQGEARPRFSAPIEVPGGSVRGAGEVKVSGGIAVPTSARAGAEDRAREEALRAAREAEEAAARAKGNAGGAGGGERLVIESATVMRGGDKRYGITVFRNLLPIRRWSPRPAECAPTPPTADQPRPIVQMGAARRSGERADAAPAKPARPLGGENRPRPAPAGSR